jgi:hypothetical protein
VAIDPTLLDLDVPGGGGEVTAKPTQEQLQTQDQILSGEQPVAQSPQRIAGALPWPLSTQRLANDSQPATSASEASPSTPGLGIDGLYQSTDFDDSRQSSMSDFGSLLGATKGISTTASSESRYEPMDPAPERENEGAGIPPPRPKKSHARKVSRMVRVLTREAAV